MSEKSQHVDKINSSRGIEHANREYYSYQLGFETAEDFLNWINGQTIADLGSGYGTLAKAVELLRLKGEVGKDTRVISINPNLADEKFLQATRRGTPKKLVDTPDGAKLTPAKHKWDFQNRSTRTKFHLQGRALARHLDLAHEKGGVANWWSDLHDIKSESCGRVVSNYAFPFYTTSEEDLRKGVSELHRILTKDGETRFNTPYVSHLWPIEKDLEKTLDQMRRFLGLLRKVLMDQGFVITEIMHPEEERPAGDNGKDLSFETDEGLVHLLFNKSEIPMCFSLTKK